MDTREKTIEFLRLSGPIIPVKLAKQLNTNILMASAFLSELTASGKVKTSHLKVGGTPLYYLPGHEHKLQSFASNLSAKEKKAYDELAEKKVLAEKNLDPLTRVSLKELRDFAVPIAIDNEPYWKWYLTPDEQAVEIIKNSTNDKRQATSDQQPIANSQQLIVNDQQPMAISQPQAASDKLQIVTSQLPTTNDQRLTTNSQQPTEKPKAKLPKFPDNFLPKVQQYFKQSKIDVLEIKPKKSDIECTIKIPSEIGSISCYCRAKFKKSITDADISSAFLQAQYRGMPLLFLYSGELNKKANEMLKEYQNIILKKLPS